MNPTPAAVSPWNESRTHAHSPTVVSPTRQSAPRWKRWWRAVVGAAYEVSNVLGAGFLEKLYE